MKLKILTSLLAATFSACASTEGYQCVMVSITRAHDYNLRAHIHDIESTTTNIQQISVQAHKLLKGNKNLKAVFDIDASTLNADTAELLLNNVPCVTFISGIDNEDNKSYMIFKELIAQTAQENLVITQYR